MNRSFSLSKSALGLCLTVGLFSACITSRKARIQESFSWGEHYLRAHQRPDGAIADPENRLFDTWETVWAAYALSYSETDSAREALKSALGYLKAQQNPEGLLCHNEKCRAQHCIETSAAYALVLQRINAPGVDVVHEAIWKKRLPQGNWEIGNPDVNEEKAYPSVTGFCVWTLSQDKHYKDSLSASVQWILDSQKANGGWGAAWEYYGTESYGFWACGEALAPFRHHPVAGAQEGLNKMLHFLLDGQDQDGSWNLVMPGLMKNPSLELSSALVLNMLMDVEKSSGGVFDLGLDFLLDRQHPDGHWDGGFFPIPNKRYEKREDVFATSLTMIALGKNLMEYTK